MSVIEVDNLTKDYGSGRGVFDVSFKIEKGEVFGFLGPNGAGKSTTIRHLMGFSKPDAGETKILDKETFGKYYQVLNKVGYIPGEIALPQGLTGWEFIRMVQDMQNVHNEEKLKEMLDLFELDDVALKGETKRMSLGVKRKLAVVTAFMSDPDVLILDEPTNNLDFKTIRWLENFLLDFENIVIIVSHNRHFLNKVCTHICDVDFGEINMYLGNYDFWYETSQLMARQAKDQNKKAEQRAKELKDFIARFSANASKSKQATSRKKLLDKIVLDDIKASSRKYPYINFKEEKSLGRDVLTTKNLCVSVDGIILINNLNLTINNYDKIAFIGNEIIITTLFKVLSGEIKPDSGEVIWGNTVLLSYFPHNNDNYFKSSKNIVLPIIIFFFIFILSLLMLQLYYEQFIYGTGKSK